MLPSIDVISGIGPKVKVTVGAIVAGCIVIGGASIMASRQVSAALNELADVKIEVAQVRLNSYALAAAAEQALRFAIENPGIRVPDPRDPTRVIVVNPSPYGPPGSR